MGVENNNAVIATTWCDLSVEIIKTWVKTLPDDWQSLFAFVPALANGKTTVVLCPDGSKEGWNLSDTGDMLRQQFIDKMTESNYSDGSNPWDWIEVGYGEYGQSILRGNNKNCYSDSEYAIEYGEM